MISERKLSDDEKRLIELKSAKDKAEEQGVVLDSPSLSFQSELERRSPDGEMDLSEREAMLVKQLRAQDAVKEQLKPAASLKEKVIQGHAEGSPLLIGVHTHPVDWRAVILGGTIGAVVAILFNTILVWSILGGLHGA